MRSVVVSSGPGVTILPNAAEHDLCPLRRSKAWQHSNSGIFGLGLSYMLIPVMEQINNPISNRVMTFGISYKTSRYSTIAKKKSLHLPLWTLCEDCLTARHCIYTRIFRVLSGRSKSIDREYILLPMVQIYTGEEFLPPHKDEECFWKACLKKNTAVMWSLQQQWKNRFPKEHKDTADRG